MKIKEALERLNHLLDPSYFLTSSRERDALRLGIEALKLVGQIHIADGTLAGLLLPGETED